MKSNSILLAYLLAVSALAGCATNKTIALDSSKKIGQNPKVVATNVSDLIKADSAEGYQQIATKYNQKGNSDLAIIAYQKSLILDQNYTKSLAGLAAIYANQALYFLAVPLLEKAVSIEPNAVNYNNLGYAYYLVKRYQEAGTVLNKAIVLDSGYTQARNNLALVTDKLTDSNHLFALGESKEAVKEHAAFDQPIPLEEVPKNQIIAAESPGETTRSLNNQTQLKQTASNIYQLNSVTDPGSLLRSSVRDKTQLSNSINSFEVALSTGINFIHTTVISRLFDVATTSLMEFKLTEVGKYLEVINGNGTKGVAGAVANKLNESGIKKIRIADARKFNLPRTYIEYRTGYRNDAVNLNHTLLNRPYLLRNDNMPTTTAIRLVLGRDLLIKNI